MAEHPTASPYHMRLFADVGKLLHLERAKNLVFPSSVLTRLQFILRLEMGFSCNK
jgi:hypothetical protein